MNYEDARADAKHAGQRLSDQGAQATRLSPGLDFPPARRPLRHSVAYGSSNKYRPVSRSKASGRSANRPTQTAGCSCPKATRFTKTATVKAMDSQRWICRTYLFKFNETSSEDELKRIGRSAWRRPSFGRLQSVRAKTCSSFGKNCSHPACRIVARKIPSVG